MKQFVSLLFFMLSFLLVTLSCKGQASITSISTPTSTRSASRAISEAISDVATNYYRAITKQNYMLAYTYLDAGATKLSLEAFTQEAQLHDKGEGKVQSYTVAAFPPIVVMTNMRVNVGPYHVHLQFRQEGNSWKIVSLDGI